MSQFIATFCYVGLLRPAPGSWGSAAAVLVAWAVSLLISPLWLILATAIAFGLGCWATAQLTRGAADHDPSQIVIDEVVGQWLALMPVFLGMHFAGAAFIDLWPGVLTAFVFFRLFDITKLGPVGWADRQQTPLGVMLDDVIAGLMAAAVVLIAAGVAHGI